LVTGFIATALGALPVASVAVTVCAATGMDAGPRSVTPVMNPARAREADRERCDRNLSMPGPSRTVPWLRGTLSTCIKYSPFFTAHRGVDGIVEFRPEVAAMQRT